MLPGIGLIVAIYAITRLTQVPIEQWDNRPRALLLAAISLPGILGIGFIGLNLIFSGASASGLIPTK